MNQNLETAATLALVAIILDVLGFLFGLLFLPFIALPFIFMVLNYFLVYARIKEGRAEMARTPSIVLGVLELLFGGVELSWIQIVPSVMGLQMQLFQGRNSGEMTGGGLLSALTRMSSVSAHNLLCQD